MIMHKNLPDRWYRWTGWKSLFKTSHKVTDRFWGNYGIFLYLIKKENTEGSQHYWFFPMMPKNPPGSWAQLERGNYNIQSYLSSIEHKHLTPLSPLPFPSTSVLPIHLNQWSGNWQLVTDEPVDVQELRRITDHFRGIYGIDFKLI